MGTKSHLVQLTAARLVRQGGNGHHPGPKWPSDVARVLRPARAPATPSPSLTRILTTAAPGRRLTSGRSAEVKCRRAGRRQRRRIKHSSSQLSRATSTRTTRCNNTRPIRIKATHTIMAMSRIFRHKDRNHCRIGRATRRMTVLKRCRNHGKAEHAFFRRTVVSPTRTRTTRSIQEARVRHAESWISSVGVARPGVVERWAIGSI